MTKVIAYLSGHERERMETSLESDKHGYHYQTTTDRQNGGQQGQNAHVRPA